MLNEMQQKIALLDKNIANIALYYEREDFDYMSFLLDKQNELIADLMKEANPENIKMLTDYLIKINELNNKMRNQAALELARIHKTFQGQNKLKMYMMN
jgi:hypothetical protein